MDSIILTLHPITDAAWTVLKDPRNANPLVQVNTNNHDNAASQCGASALSLTLDRAPKTGPDFIIGRHRDADIVLSDPASSARHCIISINDTGVPFLSEQSTNGTLINGKHCKNQNFEIQGGMQIGICDAAFEIRVPWRGSCQLEYEYKASRVKESRVRTPIESLPSRSAPIHTILVETLGSYTLTGVFTDSLKVANKEVGRTEIVRKGGSLFAAKRFNRKALGQREVRAWGKILDYRIQHPNIIHLVEIFYDQAEPVLVTELLPIGNVGEVFCDKGNTVPEKIAVGVMRQLLNALEYLHKLGIVHMRIQLDNLLVSSKQPVRIKLTGFEFSSCGEASVFPLMSACPAPEVWERNYRGSVAPLIWEKIWTDRGYSEARVAPCGGSPVDIWSAGVVCSQLTLGKAPRYLDSKKSSDEQAADYVDLLLTVRSESSTEKAVAWAQKLGLSSRSISPSLLEFLQKLLDPEPQSRAKAEDCLEDLWLTSDAQDLRAKEPHPEESVRKRRRLNSISTE